MYCSCEKRYHAGSSCFSLLQGTESWAGPGNKAITTLDDMIHMHNHCTDHSQIPLQLHRQWSIVAHGNMTRYTGYACTAKCARDYAQQISLHAHNAQWNKRNLHILLVSLVEKPLSLPWLEVNRLVPSVSDHGMSPSSGSSQSSDLASPLPTRH